MLKWPAKLWLGSHRRNKDKYCLYHRDHRHATSDCFNLKEAIEALIQRGKLKKYVRESSKLSGDWERSNWDQSDHIFTPPKEIRTVFSGLEGCYFGRKRKTKKRQTHTSLETYEVCSLVTSDLQISFSKEDATQLHQPHNDARVVSLTIANVKVHRIPVYGGSSVDVLWLLVFNVKRLGQEQLRSRPNSLVGFGGH